MQLTGLMLSISISSYWPIGRAIFFLNSYAQYEHKRGLGRLQWKRISQ